MSSEVGMNNKVCLPDFKGICLNKNNSLLTHAIMHYISDMQWCKMHYMLCCSMMQDVWYVLPQIYYDMQCNTVYILTTKIGKKC